MRAKITKRSVDALRSKPGEDAFLWDTELRGFGVWLKPSGKGAFFIQYRNREGRTRRLAIGKLGTMTPDRARAIARRKLVDAAEGADPSAERHRARADITIAEALELPHQCARQTGDQGRPSSLAETVFSLQWDSTRPAHPACPAR
jgi:hypothetical protein